VCQSIYPQLIKNPTGTPVTVNKSLGGENRDLEEATAGEYETLDTSYQKEIVSVLHGLDNITLNTLTSG
jgi:hypothetical protein